MSLFLKDPEYPLRIRILFSTICFVTVILWVGLSTLKGQESSYSAPGSVELQQLLAPDPENPSARYVLGKVNKSLVVSADRLTALEHKMSNLEQQKISEHLVRIDSREDSIMQLLYIVVGGIASIFLKDILTGIKKKTD